MRTRHAIARFAAAALLGLACAAASAQSTLLGPAVWIDDTGQPFRLQALAGGHTVLTLAYGACRRICSTSLRLMEQAQALADERGVRLNFVVVGLDPTQDKPADWAAFRAERHLARDNWHFLTGDDKAVRAMAQSLGVNYWRAGDHVMHDFKIVLLSPAGQVLRSMDRFAQPAAELLP